MESTMGHFLIWAIIIVISGLIGLAAVVIFATAVFTEIKEWLGSQSGPNQHELVPQ